MQRQQQQQASHNPGVCGPPVSGDGAGAGATLLPSSNLGPVSDGYQVGQALCASLAVFARQPQHITLSAAAALRTVQLLRMEAATQNETRRLLGCMDVAVYLSLAALLAYLVLRWQPIGSSSTYFMCTTNFRCVCGAATAKQQQSSSSTAVAAAGWQHTRTPRADESQDKRGAPAVLIPAATGRACWPACCLYGALQRGEPGVCVHPVPSCSSHSRRDSLQVPPVCGSQQALDAAQAQTIWTVRWPGGQGNSNSIRPKAVNACRMHVTCSTWQVAASAVPQLCCASEWLIRSASPALASGPGEN